MMLGIGIYLLVINIDAVDVEVGIDCVDINRFQNSSILKENILHRVFTDKEISYCQSKVKSSQHFAARFAAKEAVKKALSAYHIDLSFSKIEIVNESNGRPFVSIDDDRLIDFEIKISLSHSISSAVACAIVTKKM